MEQNTGANNPGIARKEKETMDNLEVLDVFELIEREDGTVTVSSETLRQLAYESAVRYWFHWHELVKFNPDNKYMVELEKKYSKICTAINTYTF